MFEAMTDDFKVDLKSLQAEMAKEKQTYEELMAGKKEEIKAPIVRPIFLSFFIFIHFSLICVDFLESFGCVTVLHRWKLFKTRPVKAPWRASASNVWRNGRI